MAIATKIEELVRPIVDTHEAFLIDVEVRNERGTQIVEIFVDTDTGVTTELCSILSREISRVLEDADLFRRRYHLMVSSPGLDRPLKYRRQYPKNIGRIVKVRFRSEQQSETLEGELIEVTDEDISIKTGKDLIRKVPFVQIIQTKVEARW